MAEKTVKVHRGRVMQKLGVTSVAELMGLAQRARYHPVGNVRPRSIGKQRSRLSDCLPQGNMKPAGILSAEDHLSG